MKKDALAKVMNLMRLRVAFGELASQNRRVNERFGLLIGESGIGKTTAISWLVAQTNAIYLQCSPTWTTTSMLEDLAVELGVSPQGRSNALTRASVKVLQATETPRSIFVDEANRLFEVIDGRTAMKLLEVLRSIHDEARVPVWLVGLENLGNILAHPKHVQLNSRIARRVRFVPVDLKDARIVADTLCEIQIQEDLLQDIHARSGGSMRLLVVELEQAEWVAKRYELDTLSLIEYEHGKQERIKDKRREGVIDLVRYRELQRGLQSGGEE